VLALLGVGLPAIDAAVPRADKPLRPGSVLRVGAVGTDDRRPVTLTVPAGWAVDVTGTNLSMKITLKSGPTSFEMLVVAPERVTPKQLWDGLGKIEVLTHGPRAVTRPVPFTTAQGVSGLSGELAGPGRVGIASVLARPTLSIQVMASGPPGDFRHKADQVRGMVRSIRFTGSTR
jgi:hypothetical protein